MKRYIKSSMWGVQYFLEPWDYDTYKLYSYTTRADALEMADLIYDGRCDIAVIADEDVEDYVNGELDEHNIDYIDV